MTAAALVHAVTVWTWWIEPCTRPAEMACLAADADLAAWSLDAWAAASNGQLRFERVADVKKARMRFYWAGARSGLYGEARPFDFEGQRGAEIFLRPSVTGSTDPLLRDTVVYLTCLHESGHGLGLRHTADFDDIMYSFQYGGDLVEYFARYRRRLAQRSDIRRHAGLSAADTQRLQQALRYLSAF